MNASKEQRSKGSQCEVVVKNQEIAGPEARNCRELAEDCIMFGFK